MRDIINVICFRLGVEVEKESVMQTVKVFKLGRAQAVRIPARFRFDVDEVQVFMRDGELVMRPKPCDAAELFARARAIAKGAFDDFTPPEDPAAEPLAPLEL